MRIRVGDHAVVAYDVQHPWPVSMHVVLDWWHMCDRHYEAPTGVHAVRGYAFSSRGIR